MRLHAATVDALQATGTRGESAQHPLDRLGLGAVPEILPPRLVDEVIEEPLGGAHRDPTAMSGKLKEALVRHLEQLESTPRDQLRAVRSSKIASFGVFSETG